MEIRRERNDSKKRTSLSLRDVNAIMENICFSINIRYKKNVRTHTFEVLH